MERAGQSSRQRWRRIVVVILMLAALPVVLLLFERWRGMWALNRYKAKIEASGDTLSVEVLAPKQPAADENGAPEFLEAVKRLKDDFGLAPYPNLFEFKAPGELLPVFSMDKWDSTTLTNVKKLDWSSLAGSVSAAEPMLKRMRSALHKPHFHGAINYDAGFYGFSMFHLTSYKSGAQWLIASSLSASHKGDYAGTVRDFETLTRLVQVTAGEALLISQLVRIAVAKMTCMAAWHLLHGDNLPEESLDAFQRAMGNAAFSADMLAALEMERAMTVVTYQRLRGSAGEREQMMHSAEVWRESAQWMDEKWMVRYVRLPFWRAAWSRHDELNGLRKWEFAIRGCRLALTNSWSDANTYFGQPEVGSLLDADSPTTYDRFRFLVSSQLGAVDPRIVRKAVEAQVLWDMTRVAIAIQRHRLRHDAVPDNLQALVPGFIDSVPKDAFHGQPLRYRKTEPDAFALYSVGANSTDEGGDAARSSDEESSSHNIFRGKDAVWPRPASVQAEGESGASGHER